MACGGRFYTDAITSVTVTVIESSVVSKLQASCPCDNAQWGVGAAVNIGQCLLTSGQCDYFGNLYNSVGTGYGTYVISNNQDMYMTPTDPTAAAHAALANLRIPDYPTASVALQSMSDQQPTGPTDGCFQWESLSDYLVRASAIASATAVPISAVPRICLIRALVELSGSNFGSDALGLPNALQIYLVDPNNPLVRYEAATTTNAGLQSVKCPTPDCIHTDNLVRFWIPPGMGVGLEIEIHVGNQVIQSLIRYSYLPPAISQVNPGSVSQYQPFQDANGYPIVISGSNFGGTFTNSSVFINGRRCDDSTWNSGAQTDSQGRAYLTLVFFCFRFEETKNFIVCV